MSKLSSYGEDETKKATTRSVLAHVLDQTLRMLHPYMPFITEEIWQQLPHEGASITIATWPTVNNKFHDVDASNQMEQVMAIIKSVRNIRAEVDTPMSLQVNMILKPTSTEAVYQLSVNRLFIERFFNTSELTIDEDATVPEQSMSAV